MVERQSQERTVAAFRSAVATRDVGLCVEALGPLEPAPLTDFILVSRAACYTKANHPLARLAQEELRDFKHLHSSFAESLPAAK